MLTHVLIALQATALILIGLLVFEEMPLALIGTCLMTNLMYFFVMETFPLIELTSPKFLLSVGVYVCFMNHLNLTIDL